MTEFFSFLGTYWLYIFLVVLSIAIVVFIYYLMNLGYKNPVLPDPEPRKPSVVEPTVTDEPLDLPIVEAPAVEQADVVPEPTVVKEEVKQKSPTPRAPKTQPTDLGKYIVSYRKGDNKWMITRENSVKVLKLFETKQEAVSFATIKALESDQAIVVKRKDEPLR